MISYFLRKGEDTPFVFLHGFLGSAKDWAPVASFMEHKTCIAYDLPGHGEMDWTCMEIDDLMPSAFPPEPFHLVGYSLGGRLALRYALQHPSHIRSLTLISTHYGLKTEEEKQHRLQNDRIWAQKILILPFDHFLQEWYNQPVFSSLQHKELLKQNIMASRRSCNPRNLYQALISWSLGRQPYYGNLLKTMPCRILCGELDKKFCALYQEWPQLSVLPDAGHLVHLEHPQLVAEHLLS